MKHEQRSDSRTQLRGTHVSVVDRESGVEFDGRAQDVSVDGLRFLSALEPPLGADMDLTLDEGPVTKARLHVLRVTKADDGWEVAGRLSRVG